MNWYKKQLKIAMAVSRGWSEDDLQKVKELYEKGYSSVYIAPLFGVNPATINKLNQKYKFVDFKKRKQEKYKWLAGLYLLPPDGEGMPASEIYKQHGISPKVVRLALKSLGKEEKWRGNSEAGRKKFEDNPDLKKEISEKQKQYYRDNPEARQEQSKRIKQLFIDEPERTERGLEGRLKSYNSRDEAINYLNGFIGNSINKAVSPAQKSTAFHTYNKFMEIINSHTFPDEVQQQPPQQQIEASMNWYRRAN